ncbi:MAG TPA: DUF1573 domain-containing protein [Flavobacteriales bacterium]|nr:DUF1573 domain-containing protein [Flavobacteriales bacterium]
MKLIKFFICGIILVLFSCDQKNVASEEISTDIVNNPTSAYGDETSEELPKIIFEKNAYDFGKIIQGEKVTHSFKFTNEGDAALIVTSARGTCGCTIPKWSKEPIPPGGSGEIGVVFDSDGKSGAQAKDITVVTNAIPNTSVLRLKCEVIVP